MWTWVSLFSLLLAACGGIKLEPANGLAVPEVEISCQLYQSLDCSSSNANKDFYIGLSTDTSISCRSYLLQIPQGQFALYFEAWGQSKTQYYAEIVGAVNQWKNDGNVGVVSLADSNYKACAFIDTNGNAWLDPQEVVGELIFAASEDDPIISDWN